MFCKRPLSTGAARRARLFVGLRYAPASSKPGPACEVFLPSWEGRHPSLILFPPAVSFCSRPDRLFLRKRNHTLALSGLPGEWPADGIRIAGVVWTASNAVPPLDPDRFGLEPAGPGMPLAGSSFPNPGLAACLWFILERAV